MRHIAGLWRALAFRELNRRRLLSNDGGFTIIELTVASGLMLLVLTTLAHLITASLVDVSFAKQRQAAVQLMNKTMEQVRALPFQTVASGLSDNDTTVGPDTNISTTGGWKYTGTNETIPHGAGVPTSTPLNPHQSTNALNGNSYTIQTYPTQYAAAIGAYRVTVVVSWTRSLRGGVLPQVSGQTIVYSPSSGCLAASNHPFAAPCQPYFHATSTAGSGFVTIAAPTGAETSAFQGIQLNSGQLYLAKNAVTMSIEQTSSMLGTVSTTGALLDVVGQSVQQTGAVAATASADNDPGTSSNVSNSGSASQSAGAISYSAGSGLNSITLTPASSDSGSNLSTVKATSSPPCYDLTGTAAIQSSLPCGSGSITQSGLLSAVANLYSGATSLGTATLASVDATQPSQTRAVTARLTGASNGYCTSTSGDGCVHSGASRSLGTVLIAGLPSGLTGPNGWAGTSCNSVNALVQLSNFSDSVASESGVGIASPSASQSSGTLTYWNGSGCTSRVVNWGASPPAIAVPSVSFTSNGVTVAITTTLSLGGTSTTSSTPGGCVTVCTASATSQSPLVADVLYTLTDTSGTIANIDIQVNLGDLKVTSSYQAAPS